MIKCEYCGSVHDKNRCGGCGAPRTQLPPPVPRVHLDTPPDSVDFVCNGRVSKVGFLGMSSTEPLNTDNLIDSVMLMIDHKTSRITLAGPLYRLIARKRIADTPYSCMDFIKSNNAYTQFTGQPITIEIDPADVPTGCTGA